MQNVEFGKTGYKVSRLGFGAMRLPTFKNEKVNFELSTPMIRYAIEHGVNFIDSHHFYHNGQSEEAIGKAIQGIPREKIILQTKIGMYSNYTEKKCRQLLEQALKKMKTSYIDFYFTHSIKWDDYTKYNKLFLKFTQKAMDEGLIKYRGFSCHDEVENVKKYINSGEFSAMLVQYNLLNRTYEDVIALAYEKGLGVEIMGPVGGGMLGSPDEDILKYSSVKESSTTSLALKFVLANPNIHVALSGMSTLQQVKENLATASDSKQLTNEEREKISEIFNKREKLLQLYCTACRYCMPCPQGIRIPRIFRMYNLSRVYGVTKKAEEGYLSMNPEERAPACAGCGQCEEKCPQKIPIREKLKEISEYFKDYYDKSSLP